MVMEIANSEYGFACRVDNIKEAAEGNRVLSGCTVTAQGTPDMTVDIAAGVVRIDNAYMTISAVDNKVVTAADADNDRYDIICVGKDGTVDYVAGTPSANPYPPDLPADHILLAILFVEEDSTTVETADIQDNRIIYEDSGVQVPIGGIIPWAKTITGVPALPTGWMECDGTAVSDAESPLNGQTIPNLNGNANFLYGAASSGGTKTEDFLVVHNHTQDAHGHNISIDGSSGTARVPGTNNAHTAYVTTVDATATNQATAATGTAWTGYAVVWIIRIK